MNKTKSMTANIVRNEAKNGVSDFDLMCKFGYNDLNSFHGELEKLFNGKDLIGIKDSLRSNRKTKYSPKKTNTNGKNKRRIVIVKTETLKEKEKRLSGDAIALTNKLKELRQKRQQNRHSIVEDTKSIDELIKQYDAIGKRIKEKEELDKELCKEINKLNAIHNAKQQELEVVRKTIEEQKKITVVVKGDGSIVSEAELDDSGYRDIQGELSDKKEFGQLTNVQTKALARAVAIKKNSSKEVFFTFEDKALIKAYKLL